MNSEAINNKTTFIILHKDKKHITKKLLKYLSRYYPNENYIFADGDCNDELSAFIECLNFKSLIYFHQEDLSVTHFFRKIQKALNLVETKYAMLVEFDDYIFPKAIAKLENFLDENIDYVSCGYPIPGFEVLKNNIRFYKQYTPGHWKDASEDSSLEDRISSFKNFYVSYFDLYRVDVLKRMNDLVIDCKLHSLLMYEFIYAFAALCEGKQKRMRGDIHYIRQYNTSLGFNLVHGDFVREMLEKNFTQDLNLSHDYLIQNYVPIDLQKFASNEFFSFFEKNLKNRIYSNYIRHLLKKIGLGSVHRQKIFKRNMNVNELLKAYGTVSNSDKCSLRDFNNYLMEENNE